MCSQFVQVHGCFLRLDRPGEYRAYLVDPRFPKRADAKAAVCLQALSHGAGDYVRAIGKAIEARVTPSMKTWANDKVYPVLLSEYSKLKTGHPNFTYEKEKDGWSHSYFSSRVVYSLPLAFGCTMTLQLANDPTFGQTRKWTAPNEYRNKADARVAVICTAVEQGAIEFVRFRGEPPPLGYTSPYSLQNYVPEPSQKSNGKRKMTDSEEIHAESDKPAKRQKKTKLEGVQLPCEQPTPKDTTRPKKRGSKPKGSSIHTHGVPESGGIRAAGMARGGISGSYQPGLGGESSSGTAYRTPQGGHFDISMNRASFPPPMPGQLSMPNLHYSMQCGYTPPLRPYAGTTSGHGALGSTEALDDDSSEPEPGEVF